MWVLFDLNVDNQNSQLIQSPMELWKSHVDLACVNLPA